jgi:hypothetical protein
MKKDANNNENNHEKAMFLKTLQQQYASCQAEEKALMLEKTRRLCLTKLTKLDSTPQSQANQLAYIIKLKRDIAHYEALITYYTQLSNQLMKPIPAAAKLLPLFMELVKSIKSKAEKLMDEIMQAIGMEPTAIEQQFLSLPVPPQPFLIAQIHEVTEAFLRTDENQLTLNDLRQLAEVLTQLKTGLDKQEKAYHEEGYTQQQLRELYDARMVLSTVYFKVDKLIMVKS